MNSVFIFPIEYIEKIFKDKKEENNKNENQKQEMKNDFEKYLKKELAKYKNM